MSLKKDGERWNLLLGICAEVQVELGHRSATGGLNRRIKNETDLRD
jgi:hypothetical protein